MAFGRVPLRRYFFDYLAAPAPRYNSRSESTLRTRSGHVPLFPDDRLVRSSRRCDDAANDCIPPSRPESNALVGIRNCACCRDQSVRVAHALPIISGSHAFGNPRHRLRHLELGRRHPREREPASHSDPAGVGHAADGGILPNRRRRHADRRWRRRRADREGARAIHARAEKRAGRTAPARTPNDRRYTADAR